MLFDAGGRVLDDRWRTLETDAEPGKGPLVIEWQDWLQRGARLASGGPLGLLLDSEDPIEDVLAVADRFQLIALSFETFADGRHYSNARLIKTRSGFRGELRAVGDVALDQLFYLVRAGFDTIEIDGEPDVLAVQRALGTFSEVYQAALDERIPAYVRRRTAVN